MQKVVFVFLFSCFSLTIVSCSEKDDFDITRWEKYGAIQLSAPANLTATGADSKVTLDWTVLSGATSYNVYWDNATGVSSSSTTITGISTDNYTHSSLNNGTTYYYKVAAVDSNGATGFLSSEVNSTPTKDYALDFDGTNDYVAADGVTRVTLTLQPDFHLQFQLGHILIQQLVEQQHAVPKEKQFLLLIKLEILMRI